MGGGTRSTEYRQRDGRRSPRRKASVVIGVLAFLGIGVVAIRAVSRADAPVTDASAEERTTTGSWSDPFAPQVVDADSDTYEDEDVLRIEIPLKDAGAANSPQSENTDISLDATAAADRGDVNPDLDPLQLVIADGQMVMTGTARSNDEAEAMVAHASEVFTTTEIIRDFTIDPTAPVPSRGVIVRKPVAFESGSADIRPEFEPVLDACADVMVHNPTLVMTISGHTDATGSEDLNLELAEARAQAVVDYYTSKGLADDKFAVAALGESDPLAENSTPEGRATNRRADLEFEEVFDDVIDLTATEEGDD